MRFSLPESIAGALQTRLDGRPVGLLFDYDGTLAPIVPHPKQAILDDTTRSALLALPRPNIHVGVITGRTLEGLTEVAGALPGLAIASNGGLRLAEDGRTWVNPDVQARLPALNALREALHGEIERWYGSWIEDKGLSLTVHFRACPKAGPVLRASAERALQGTDKLRLIDGKQSFEVQPAIPWDKGRAAMALLDRWNVGRACFFIGDDVIDEPAFEAVRGRGGVTCCVLSEPRATHAEWTVPGVEAVRALLALLPGALR